MRETQKTRPPTRPADQRGKLEATTRPRLKKKCAKQSQFRPKSLLNNSLKGQLIRLVFAFRPPSRAQRTINHAHYIRSSYEQEDNYKFDKSDIRRENNGSGSPPE
jgi:hypothetical protein